eukprot:414513-Pelagomonas_calceolata.AAC.8
MHPFHEVCSCAHVRHHHGTLGKHPMDEQECSDSRGQQGDTEESTTPMSAFSNASNEQCLPAAQSMLSI